MKIYLLIALILILMLFVYVRVKSPKKEGLNKAQLRLIIGVLTARIGAGTVEDLNKIGSMANQSTIAQWINDLRTMSDLEQRSIAQGMIKGLRES